MITTEKLMDVYHSKSDMLTIPENEDNVFKIVSLLRNRLPNNVCKSVISGTFGNGIITLCDINVATEFLDEFDAVQLFGWGCRVGTQNNKFYAVLK